MIIKIFTLLALFIVAVLIVCNVKSHNMYPKLDQYIKCTLAVDWLVMCILFIYLLVKVVRM